MFRERMIVPDSLTANRDGYQISARLPWYRALPLSCIERVEIVVDGVSAPPDAICLSLDGVELPLDETDLLTDRSWFVLDDLVIRVRGLDLTPQERHDVELTMAVRIPYLPVEGRPLVVAEHLHATMTSKEAAA